MPPTSGVGATCHRPVSGRRPSLRPTFECRSDHTTAAAIGKAERAASVGTWRGYSGRVSGVFAFPRDCSSEPGRSPGQALRSGVVDALEARVAAGGRARLGAWAPPAAVAAVTLALGSFDLTRRSYWIDEAFNVLLVREPWSTYLRTIGAREPSQGVYLLFLKPYTALVGRSEFATRLPSVLAAAAAAALLVDLGRRLFGTRVAVVAGVLLAVDGRFVEWSQYARTYSLAVLAA